MTESQTPRTVWKGSALLAPVPPALVTCGSMENPNILTVAWTGILCTIPPKTYISLRPERFSYPLIEQTGAFVINLPTVGLLKAVDFCGVRSGRDTDKLKTLGLSVSLASSVEAPILDSAPVSLECVVTDKLSLGSHTMFLADIAAVSVQSRLLNAAGKLELDKAQLLAYAHGAYFALGEQLGTFGFSVKKSARKRKK
ncbi:MAG: flavin reductase family protein [Oscillospiraceae bacterium]